MSGRTKARRHRRPGRVSLDPVGLAIHNACRPGARELEEIVAPIRQAFTALREGVATEMQWCVLASSVNIALTIEERGVVRGLAAHLTAADLALHAINRRAMEPGHWRPTAMYWQEIDAIDEFIPLHRFQLEQLSRREVLEAVDRARAQVCNAGGRVIDVKAMGEHEQLQLLGART